MKKIYMLLFIYEGAMPTFDLYIMYILVLKSIILVLCRWYPVPVLRVQVRKTQMI